MYSFSEEEGYSLYSANVTQTFQYSTPDQSFKQTTSTELQWEFTSNGYSRVQASDLLFKEDCVNQPVNTQPKPLEQETEHNKCKTWYVPSKPLEKPSRSQEYVAPHKRFEGYERTHNYNGRSNIRGHTISSSGESSHYAQSRSQSRQRQHQPNQHHRSASRSSYNANSAPVVSRERTQPRRQMSVNLTRRTERTTTRNRAPSQRQPASGRAQTAPRVRKVDGIWIKNKPKSRHCFQFFNHGTCSFGDRCKFEHVANNTPVRSRPVQRDNKTWGSWREAKGTRPRKQQQSTTTTTSFVSRNRFDFSNRSNW